MKCPVSSTRPTKSTHLVHRSLPISEWPDADRKAWEAACRPSCRLKPGGAASHLAEVSREDFARRYGAFLGFLRRTGKLNPQAAAAAQVIKPNVEAYVDELKQRVRSVTVWNCIYKLRRAAELLNPSGNYGWLLEMERDLALVMEPRSKFDRLVLSHCLVKAGLTLIAEAREFAKSDFDRAKGVRNGLMIVLLALCPMRIKNFAALEIGRTLKEVNGSWWIALSKSDTKAKSPEERRVPRRFNDVIDLYLDQSRPILMRSAGSTNALWISSRTGQRFTTKNLGILISKITLDTLGVDVSPHLFRTAAATTSAMYGSDTPHLASGVLGHRDRRVTQEHYIRATSINAAKIYAEIIQQLRSS
jgi:site-specific recombinase XerD